MLRSLLVPLDGTRFGEYALPLAEGVAQASGAALHLAHVHVPNPPTGLIGNTPFQYEGIDLEAYEEKDRNSERGYMSALAERVSRESSAPVDTALLEGDVSAALTQYAHEVGADALVLSTHSRTGARRAWLGSVAEGLIRAGTLPVLVIHAEEGSEIGPPLEINHVLIPLDGSELAESILTSATELVLACDARITLLHILPTRHPGPDGMIPSMPEQWTQALQEGESYLEEVAGPLRRRGIRVDTMAMAHPDAGPAIREVAEEAGVDLIAMATHGYTGIRRILFGSVAEDVLRHAHVPMLIRRPD
jgi:nucleotide-binding universal stress UspA family protein